ncbi:Hypothetical predicted protein [Pelobates cultripes]|uniref:Helix-turn-helix domain-containing protein n=2 Tax=Pelobates cultripes TaxID=61616 RepID=A0AAD1R316_PELCU|nr:Hypothetical predicted protein [Pelobates cultripes]
MQAQEMVEFINQLPTPIRMTANLSTERVQFLDVELSVEDHRMVYCLYSKPTDRNTILHYNSAHPKNLIKSIPKAQFLRVMRNNSKETTKRIQLQEMKMKFLDRGYSERVLDKALEEAEENATTLQDITEVPKLIFPMTFHSKTQKINSIVKRNWNMLACDNSLPKEFKQSPRICYRRNRNLKDILMKTDPVESYTEQKITQVRGSVRCLGCVTCSHMVPAHAELVRPPRLTVKRARILLAALPWSRVHIPGIHGNDDVNTLLPGGGRMTHAQRRR